MNLDLHSLYLSNWDQLLQEASSLAVQAANPLLIKVNKSYIDADIKVMIVGQETDRWHSQLNKGELTVNKLMSGYLDYFNQLTKDGKDRWKRAFWNRKNYRFFEEEISKYYSDKNVSFIWNNISKIGNDGRGKPHPLIQSLERNYFNIFAREFEILKPDIVIFTTGASRDSYIKHHFGDDIEFIPKLSLGDGGMADETLNLIAEVKFPQFPSINAIRIEHPNRRTLSNLVSLKVLESMLETEA